MSEEIKKRGVGRPKKKKLPRGRPKGEAAIMKDYRMRMLRSPKSKHVLKTIFEVATDPDHKHWPAASKMVMDRIAPAGGFEVSKNEGSKVEINITGITTPSVSTESAIDVDFEPVDKDE